MRYTESEVLEFIKQEEVKFIFLHFVDILGEARVTTIMPSEMERAIKYGIAFDGSAIAGFKGDNVHSDLFLHPSLDTLTLLPWRPDEGKAVKFFSFVTDVEGRIVNTDSRKILLDATEYAKKRGLEFYFGTEYEFYLFNTDERGNISPEPIDNATYMSPPPFDKGDQIRREICLMLEELSLKPEASHHEEGPGQNEIDFSYSDALKSADNSQLFLLAVRTVSLRNGLFADFSPRPIEAKPGNGLHINISVKGKESVNLDYVVNGILKYIKEFTLFLNPTEASYLRLGHFKAPSAISVSSENRSELIRIPAAKDRYVRAEVRSPDSSANIYLSFALLIYASTRGVEEKIERETLKEDDKLPLSLKEAKEEARKSRFLKEVLPKEVLDYYLS